MKGSGTTRPPDASTLPASGIVVFCGAGLSTASGIPDFRSPGGLWTRFDPDEFSVDRFRADPDRFWARRKRLTVDSGILDASPNAGHAAIARAVAAGRVASVVTQNIDGLQVAAGTDPAAVIELHGNVHRSRCMDCGETTSTRSLLDALPEVDDEGRPMPGIDFAAPRCTCGGVWKPDVVLFGEPVTRLQTAARSVARASCLLVVGTSLRVYPAAGLVDVAHGTGVPVVIANRDVTPYDVHVDRLLRGPVEETLAALFP